MSEAQAQQESNEQTQEPGQEKKEEYVSKDVYSRAMDDLRKQKQAAREAQQEIENLKRSQLESKEEYKTLYEREKQNRESIEGKYKNLSGAVEKNEKYRALAAIAAKEGMINLDDLDMVPYDEELAVEKTSTGRMNVLGAEDFLKSIKEKRPYWFKNPASTKINTDSPGAVTGQGITIEMVMEAEKEAKKTGNISQYQKILMEFKKQQIRG